ncbi:hypothetical protein AMECASPLE_023879 [Ameca splendens]|uniref:Uncharacterized protein n=1 Tax=Ameca splendens TaxID=208324 RepID=A0ABV1AAJ7_9TELE
MFTLLSPPAEVTESDKWLGVGLALFFPLPSSARTVCSRCCCPLAVGSHCGVVLGREAALLPGGSCWQRQLWRCVFSSPCLFQLPFLPLYNPLPQPDGLQPGSNPFHRAGSPFEHVCTEPSSVLVGPNQTGQHRCDRLTGMLGMRRRWSGCVHPWPGAEGEGSLSIGRRLSSALLADSRTDWLVTTMSAVTLLKMACSTFMVLE